MAGFEVIVRPVVLPNIRPAPPRVLPSEDDPEQGIAVIGGSGGGLIDLPHTWSVSVSRQRPQVESKRQFDKERVYQVEKDKKTINFDNFVDLERLRMLRLETEEGPVKMIFADPPKPEPNNIEVLEADVVRKNP
jgi:hypothetical protein